MCAQEANSSPWPDRQPDTYSLAPTLTDSATDAIMDSTQSSATPSSSSSQARASLATAASVLPAEDDLI
eukprot:3389426-Alexandrium_andersonii.AAC.1